MEILRRIRQPSLKLLEGAVQNSPLATEGLLASRSQIAENHNGIQRDAWAAED